MAWRPSTTPAKNKKEGENKNIEISTLNVSLLFTSAQEKPRLITIVLNLEKLNNIILL